MKLDEFLRKGAFLRVQDVGDITLLPQLDPRLRLVASHQFVAHFCKQFAQLFRVRTGKLYKFKTIGACGVFVADDRFRGVVRERSHA